MASFSDNFNRSDGALGANWQAGLAYGGPPVIVGNAARVNGWASGCVLHTGEMASGDYEVSAVVMADSAWVNAGIVGRATTSGVFEGSTGYCLYFSQPDSLLLGLLGGAGLDGVTFEFEEGHSYQLRMRFEGANIKCYVDDELLIEVTEATYSTGRAGLSFYGGGEGGTPHWDDFFAIDLADMGGGELGGTLTPTTWANKWALESLTM